MRVDDTVLAGLRRARAHARERAWLLRGEAGRPVPTVRCGGVEVSGLEIDFDASLVTCHSEKEQAAATFKKGYGYHPVLVWLDNTNEALAGMLRPGNAGSNTAADHIRLTDEAFAQIPDAELSAQPFWSAAPGPAPPRNGWPISAAFATGVVWMCGSQSGSPSPTRSKTPSRDSPKRCGPRRSTRMGRPARSTRRDCR